MGSRDSLRVGREPHCATPESRLANPESVSELFAHSGGRFRPIDGVPPRGDVVGAAVLILQVIRMFPDVESENGLLAFHDGLILIGRAFDAQLPPRGDQPGPAAAETADSSFCELLLEAVEAAK